MTEYMQEIHGAIVQCMSTTLSELKRSNTNVRTVHIYLFSHAHASECNTDGPG